MKNHRVSGTIAFYLNDQLHSVVEYETAYQRGIAKEKFLETAKKIRSKVVIYYVISTDESSLPCHTAHKQNKLLPDLTILPKPLNKPQTQKKISSDKR